MARPLIHIPDRLAQRWLSSSTSPYVDEIAEIARIVGEPGVFLINTSYEWACTVATRHEETDAPVLLRTLDWPYAGLGRGVVVTWQSGPAGIFFNVTWPGAVGVLTAMAPGRFCATINHAPLYRRTKGNALRLVDLALNAVHTYSRTAAPPPAHGLRQVFEKARDFGEAKAMIAKMPVARPVLIALAGMTSAECCVIERTETEANVVEGPIVVANDWQSSREGWEPRSCGGPVDEDSRDRRAALAVRAKETARPFDWVYPPVHNWATRIAVELCAGDETLRVIGFEPAEDGRPSVQVTLPFDLAGVGTPSRLTGAN